MVETSTTPFTMHGARNAIAGGLAHIEEQVQAIEQAVVENPSFAFDLARTLIESVCRAVLLERSIPFSENEDLPRLFKTTTSNLAFLPPEASQAAEVRQSLAQTLNGLHTAVQGICELRNQCGFASHGSGGPRPAMESVQALLAAEAADAIVGFLYRVNKQGQIVPANAPFQYKDNEAFNESIDESHALIRIFDEEFQPSLVLFEMAPEPYRVYLAEFSTETENDEATTPSDRPAEVAP